jgi:O-antigen/teichoic acid export membrane protein
MVDVSEQEPLIRKGKPEAPARRRLAVNYFFQLLNQLVRICEQLLLVPLFLSAWGTDIYKDWVVLYAIMVFLTSCNFGTETYFGNRFIDFVARNDREAFRRELMTSLFCTLAVGALVLGASYAVLFGYSGGLLPSGLEAATIYRCLLLMTLPVVFIFAQQTLLTVYRAEGEFSRGECAYAIYACVQMIAVTIALAAKLPPTAAASVYLVMPGLLLIGIMIDLKLRYRDIVFGLRVPTLADLRRILPQSLLFFTLPLSLALVQSGPVMLFGAMGVAALPVLSYTLIRTFTGLTRQAANQFAVGSGIEMARHQVRGEGEACRRLYDATGQIVTILVGLFGGFTIWAADPFLTLWTHGTVHSNEIMVLGFLGGIFLAAPGQAALMLLNYTNTAKPLAIAWCSQAFVGLALSAALVPVVGVVGAAFSFAAAESVAVGFWLPLVVQRRFGFSAIHHLARGFVWGVLAFGWSAFVAKLAFELGLSGFKGLAATVALWAIVALPPFALFAMPARYRKAVLSRLRGIAARVA